MEVQLAVQIFGEKNLQIREISSIGSRVVPCGQTDRHDEANGRFLAILRTRQNSNNIFKKITLKI